MNLWEFIKCKTEMKFVFAGSGCGTRCTAAMPFMIRPCLKPLPGQTSVLWVMMVLKLLCSLLHNFLSTKSATRDLFLLWGRSLGCRCIFSQIRSRLWRFLFSYWTNDYLKKWYDVYTGNLLDGAIQKLCEGHFFFFRAKGGRHDHCPNNVVSSAGFNAC